MNILINVVVTTIVMVESKDKDGVADSAVLGTGGST